MNILEKLDLLNLDEKERTKVADKFLVTLSLVTIEELKERIAYLNKEGVVITKAKDLKVLTISVEELAKKFSILNEIHESDIYKKCPTTLNYNVIDIYKKIQYCKQMGIEYKDESQYQQFLIKESLWQEIASKEVKEEIIVDKVEEPVIEIEETKIEDSISKPVIELVTEPIVESVAEEISLIDDSKYMDIKDYKNASNDLEELEAKTTNFDTVKKELEFELAKLESSNDDYEISFNDFEPENFGWGEAA